MPEYYQEIRTLSTLLKKLRIKEFLDCLSVNCVTVYIKGQNSPIHITVDLHPRIHKPLKPEMTSTVLGPRIIDGTVFDPSDALIPLQLQDTTPTLRTGRRMLAPLSGH
jgi:hypothetical protein